MKHDVTSPSGAPTPETADDALALARTLGDRLARAGQTRHELRLARALMLDVVELLEASTAA
jgi:hypothetical protein